MKEGGLMMENKCVLGACKLAAFLYSLCTNILAPLLVSISREFGIGLQKSGGMFLAFCRQCCSLHRQRPAGGTIWKSQNIL